MNHSSWRWQKESALAEVKVAPSLLACDPLKMGLEAADVEALGADWLHVDVMDGHFVPQLTFGLPFVAALRKQSQLPLDVHIMVTNPDAVALDYVGAGAHCLVFPVESAVHHHRLLQAIQGAGAKAGVAINPGTSLEVLRPLIPNLDIINVMSVNPGFGGQAFIPESIGRIADVAAMIAAAGRQDQVLIEVDGGINAETAPLVVAAGARVLVAGSYVFNHKDRRQAIATLKKI
jgi:ribulose-phosphate 3-epimerase